MVVPGLDKEANGVDENPRRRRRIREILIWSDESKINKIVE